MALMARHGEITPMPDCAIFADTGWEPMAVYEWLDLLETQLPFPVHRVSAGNIREDHVSKRRTTMPFFSSGMSLRQCTAEYKIAPIEKFIKRTLLGLEPGKRVPADKFVVSWRGISADEAHRMKPSPHTWMAARFPLAMEKNMSRGDCFAWMEKNGYPEPPRSACIGCPFHNDQEWLAIRERPDEWADAVEFDRAIRNLPGMNEPTYLHRSQRPLDKVEFLSDRQLDLWGEECEGMCGV